MNEQYKMSPTLRMVAIVLIAIGALSLGYGVMTFKGEEVNRLWANLLLNSVFFLGICMASAFFIAAHYLAWGGWWITIKRIPEAIMGYVPVGALILLLVLIFGGHNLYHWMDHSVMDPNDPHYDAIIAGKSGYLNNPFFYGRFFLFLGVLITTSFMLRKASIMEDNTPHGDTNMHKRSLVLASVFLPFFAVYISVSSWDWLMSIDTHWFSTMFGWYYFASFWVTGVAVITLTVIYLKSRGYLPQVNENHLHDLGKYMFAFSIFWTYLTYCQYMLIWYANLPEETVYFKQRYEQYDILFYGIFILNFVCPFLILMSRDAKRNKKFLIVAACIIIFGHFVDFFLMVMPGVVGEGMKFGILEIGLPFLFIGIILLITHTRLGNAPLVPKNSPFLEESLHHEI